MKITVNGQVCEVDEGTSLLALLERLDQSPSATVVEKNGEILDRASYADTMLGDGDTLELVRFVGGG